MKKIILTLFMLGSIQSSLTMHPHIKTTTIIDYAKTINKFISIGIFLDIDPILSAVCKNEKPDFVSLVKQAGFLHKKDFNGKTPLENALQEDAIEYKEIIEILVIAGTQQTSTL